jgi:hypothetical protein
MRKIGEKQIPRRAKNKWRQEMRDALLGMTAGMPG